MESISANKLADLEALLYAASRPVGLTDIVAWLRLENEKEASDLIIKLAKLYDGMESRAVAKLMGNLDDETVVSILPRMKTKNASEVLQLLPAKRAAKLSKRMITIAEGS